MFEPPESMSTVQSAVGGRAPDSKLPSRMMVVGQVVAAARLRGRETVTRRMANCMVLVGIMVARGKVTGMEVGFRDRKSAGECGGTHGGRELEQAFGSWLARSGFLSIASG